jgi:hypothetical protein
MIVDWRSWICCARCDDERMNKKEQEGREGQEKDTPARFQVVAGQSPRAPGRRRKMVLYFDFADDFDILQKYLKVLSSNIFEIPTDRLTRINAKLEDSLST